MLELHNSTPLFRNSLPELAAKTTLGEMFERALHDLI